VTDTDRGFEPVQVPAPAKLTLHLRIDGVRDDGYHLIDAEMVTLDLCDVLHIEPGNGLEISGDAPAVVGENLVDRALALVGGEARVRLDKRIPAGAGLGGGSADAAAVLRWAGWTDLRRAGSIGADVPFCLVGGRARVRGIGDVIEPMEPQAMTLTLLTPEPRCSTPEVYARWDEMGGPRGENGNDLEPAALHLVPELATARDELAAASGHIPRLAGSGSTWFVEGAFPGGNRVVVRTADAAGDPIA
jgi:4-diphosphocytidyl-2-C-methyl-D-erythritol kinase